MRLVNLAALLGLVCSSSTWLTGCQAFATPSPSSSTKQQQLQRMLSLSQWKSRPTSSLAFSSHPLAGLQRPPSFAPSSFASSPALTRLAAATGAAASLPASASALAKTLFVSSGTVPFLPALGLNAVLFTLLSQKLLNMLTVAGFWHAMALGTGLWMTLGWKGWTYCVLYLFLGSLVTKIRFADKEKRGLAEGRGGRRGPENVWGSAATGLACAICSSQANPTLFGLGSDLYILAYVASIATKLADTFASEIGKAYGKTTFLITNLQRVEPGTEGAVSAEGTAAAVLGGLLLSLYGYSVGLLKDGPAVAVSTMAAFLATNAESVLGATLQGKKGFDWMTNEVVNAINTLIGAGLAVAGGIFVLGMR